MRSKRAWIVALMCLGLALLCGCPPAGNSSAGSGGTKIAGTGVTTEPGMDFHRKDIGMPVTTLDYIGDAPLGLAGARGTGQVFFAVQGKTDAELYVRNPATLERRMLGQVPQLQQGSLTTSADGEYLLYCRQRDRGQYIDDPKVTYPDKIAVVTRYEVSTGKEDVLFDFKTQPFLAYRNNELTPLISRDGSFAATVSYNMERLTLARMLGDWLALEADFRDRQEGLSEEERLDQAKKLRQLLVSPAVKQLLAERNVTVAADGAPVEAERAAMEALYKEQRSVEAVLLLWEDGSARVLPLKTPDAYRDSLIFIVALDRNLVLLWPQPLTPDPAVPNEFYRVDLTTGEMSLACSFLGTPSTFELSEDNSAIDVVFNPTDLAKQEIMTETRLLHCPLDGSTPVETSLHGDYLGYIDLAQDGRFTVGQDQDNYNLVLCDTQAQQNYVQIELPNAISGVFIDQQLTHAVFLDAGVLYAIPLSSTPTQTEGYLTAEYFKQYTPVFETFLQQLGFKLGPELRGEYEERWGLNTHEVSVQLENPQQPGKLALMRYSVDDNQVVAAWFPQGYPLENTLFPPAAKQLDYYETKARAEQVLDNLGWLNPQTRTVYQPGPNPLYDGRTDSYILLFRDGYWFDEAKKDKWIINKEVTVRIIRSTGVIAELSISQTEPIHDQPFTLDEEQLLFSMRNDEDMPLPEDAPVRFDMENKRYVIDMAADDNYGPAKYSLGQRQRVCFEVDAYITPENELIATYRVDTETGAVLGRLDFQPTSMSGIRSMGAQ